MDRLLLLLLLWGSGVEGNQDSSESLRLVGGARRCTGTLQVKHEGDWRPVDASMWSMKTAAAFCEHLDCGAAVSVGQVKESSLRPVLRVKPACVQSGSALKDCVTPRYSYHRVELTCSDSVRLLNGSSLCSGSLQVSSHLVNQVNQNNQQWWSVCDADFDLQDAQVACRELGCGAPAVLQGAPSGAAQGPVGGAEFQCGGQESALLDCSRPASGRSSCSPVGLTCSEPSDDLRLVGGAGRCSGTLQVKHLGDWRPAYVFMWGLQAAAPFCHRLDCGAPLHAEQVEESQEQPVWWINSTCVRAGSAPGSCSTSENFPQILKLNCSDSVRLLNGSSLCSGSLQVSSHLVNQVNQSNQQWWSVCEADFDLQDAQVACRELGCGAPGILQGAPSGAAQGPVGGAEFQCRGWESALQDCSRPASGRRSCSPLGLTCSEPLRLVDGDNRCSGTLQMSHAGEWRRVYVADWNLQVAAAFCERLSCGAPVSALKRFEDVERLAWRLRTDRVAAGSDLRDALTSRPTTSKLLLTCSELQ